MAEPALKFISVEEYVARENAAETKSEYFDGEIFGMAGGTRHHGLVGGNLIREIGNLLKGKPCRVYTSDVRLVVLPTGLRTYPDLSVVCGPDVADDYDPDATTNPVLLVEVLSPSTERYDRSVKYRNYCQIPSLRELLFVASDGLEVERHWRPDETADWSLEEFTSIEDVIGLDALGVGLSMREIYAGVRF